MWEENTSTEQNEMLEEDTLDLFTHKCDPDLTEDQTDYYGIFLCRTCPVCHDAKMRQYRPDINEDYFDPSECGEVLEPEDY